MCIRDSLNYLLLIERTTKPSVVVPSLAAIAAEITATSSVSSVRSVAGAEMCIRERFIGERKGCSQLRYGTVFEGLTESKLWI